METDRLLAVIEVPYDDRVRCMAPTCGHSVYKRVHIVRRAGELHVLGSSCFSRIYLGHEISEIAPQFTSKGGRQLSKDERALLLSNTAKLIDQFAREHTPPKKATAPPSKEPATEYFDEFLPFNKSRWRSPRPSRMTRQSPPFSRRPEPFTPAQRASVEPEARATLNARFQGIDLDSPGFNGLLQSEIDRILRSRMA